MAAERKTFEDYTREYVEAGDALQAFTAGLPDRQMTAEQGRGFEELYDDMLAKQAAWHEAFHDPAVR